MKCTHCVFEKPDLANPGNILDLDIDFWPASGKWIFEKQTNIIAALLQL